jgi:Uma2 family endonuclease
MNTIEEIEQAIRQLSRGQRDVIADWIRDFVAEDYRVAEPPAAYGAKPERNLMSVEEYLKFEESSPVKHEYIGGQIFAMSGPRVAHGVIVTNLLVAFHAHLRGGPCRAFAAEIKVRLKANNDEIFYYPDVMVACEHNDLESAYVTNPRLVVEVLSPSTERTDRKEKAFNYRNISSLEDFVLVAQREPQVTIYRRCEEWRPLVLSSLEEMAEFRSIDLSLPLTQIYEDVL